VERVTVEDMMSHSFKEYGQQLKVPENKEKLRQYEEKFSTLQALSDHLQPLCEFYDVCFDYIQEWNLVMVSFWFIY
jgi:superfamily II RNA helicase